MKRLVSLLVFASISILSFAQTIQNGVVQEYNEKDAKTPLEGVELNVRSAGSTVSDKMGNFALSFLTLKPGEKVVVRRIEKPGYEVFNKEAVEQWNISTSTPFKIVMCRSDKFKSLKDLYYRNSEERYNKQYKQALEELQQLREQNKIQQQEYSERLKKIGEEYDKQLDNLDNYVDCFARIDLSELSANEQEIVDLVQQGEIDEAIKRYDELNASAKLISNIQARKEVQSALSQLTDVDENLAQANDSLYAMVERQIQTLQLAGADNNRKIQKLYCDVADADTTNVSWLLKTGCYICEYIADYELSLYYFQIALNNAIFYGSEHRDVAKSYGNIGSVYDFMGNHAKALEYYQKELAILERIYGPEHPVVAISYDHIGIVYCSMGDYVKALEYHQKSLAILECIFGSEDPAIATGYNNIGVTYASLGDSAKAMEYHQKSLAIRERIYGSEHPDVATSYNNIGVTYASLGDSAKAMEYHQKSLAIRERIYGSEHPEVAKSYGNIGSVYASLGDSAKALEYYQKGLAILERIYGSDYPDVEALRSDINFVRDKLEETENTVESK